MKKQKQTNSMKMMLIKYKYFINTEPQYRSVRIFTGMLPDTIKFIQSQERHYIQSVEKIEEE